MWVVDRHQKYFLGTLRNDLAWAEAFAVIASFAGRKAWWVNFGRAQEAIEAGRRGAACNCYFDVLRCYGTPVGMDASLQCSKWRRNKSAGMMTRDSESSEER